jgi:hypothetical protein
MRRYQEQVDQWMQECFGPEVAGDVPERNHRFLEEALELVQANGCTSEAAHQLVDYVFGRPVGVRTQEIGGVMVTLAALCNTGRIDMELCGRVELLRCWEVIETIRAKQKAKPAFGPLPGPSPAMVLEAACERINFRPRERKVLRLCLWARSQVSNGNFLVLPSCVPAAERLIARGYLTKSENQTTPYDPRGFGMVVVLEQENWSTLIADANALLAPASINKDAQ